MQSSAVPFSARRLSPLDETTQPYEVIQYPATTTTDMVNATMRYVFVLTALLLPLLTNADAIRQT